MISLTEIAIIASNYLVLSKFTTTAHSGKYHSLQILYLEIQERLLLCKLCYRPPTHCLTILRVESAWNSKFMILSSLGNSYYTKEYKQNENGKHSKINLSEM